VTRVRIFPDLDGAGEHAASEIARALREALEQRGVAHLALCGGNSPRHAYETLASLLDDWSAVELWYGDERCVVADDPQSTHLLVASTLLAPIAASGRALPREHRVRGELGPEAAAREYSEELRASVAPAAAGGDGPPILDVALLGIGEDGHTASLFPGHPEVLDNGNALCLPVRDSPKPPPERVTLSVPVLRAARLALLLAAGAAKAAALAAALAGGGRDPDPRVPASLIVSERLYVVADAAAGASIGTDPYDSSNMR
jgi:6-phosphogluconolactonase